MENSGFEKKALIIATVGRFLIFEKKNIEILKSMGYEIHCASNFELKDTDKVSDIDIIKHQIDFARSPFSFSNIIAYNQLKKLFQKVKFNLVHCHTPVAGFIGRFVAKKYRKEGAKIFYTAHGFHFYTGASLKNWLLFYPAEWVCSWWTDVQITINTEDYQRVKKRFHAKQIVYVPGIGIDTNQFERKNIDVEVKRRELNLKKNDFMLLSVGELNCNKNHAVIIKALSELKNNNVHYYIAGNGEMEDSLRELAVRKGIEKQVHLLGYREDIVELLQVTDVYLLPSIREGLNVSLMEAMSCSLPCICSDIRGNRDLIVEEKGGYRVKSTDIFMWKAIIEKLLINKCEMKKFGEFNRQRIQLFSSEIVTEKMKKIYIEAFK